MRHPAAVATLALSLLSCPLLAQDRIENAGAVVSSQIQGPLPIGVETDVYCVGWLGEPNEPMSGRIAGADAMESATLFGEGDVVYLDIGTAQGCLPGQEYWIVRADRPVYEDMIGQTGFVGRIYNTPGRLRVICAQETSAIAEITMSCGDVWIGDTLLPFEPIPIPLVRRTRPVSSCDAPDGKMIGRIVDVKESGTTIGESTVVYIDMGEAQGLAPGDFLTVHRTRPNGVRTILGEVAVLTTRSHTATAIVTSSRDFMQIGDLLEPK